MDPLAIATFVLAGVTVGSVVVMVVDGITTRRHDSAEQRDQRRYDRLQNAYAKLRVAAILALQLQGAMKAWPLAVMAIPAGIRSSAAMFPQHAERLRDLEAGFAYTRLWNGPPWQRRSDQLVEAIVEATGWIRPLRNELDRAKLDALDAAGEKLATMMNRVAPPWAARSLVKGYLVALNSVLDDLERLLNQQVASSARHRR